MLTRYRDILIGLQYLISQLKDNNDVSKLVEQHNEIAKEYLIWKKYIKDIPHSESLL